jgi:putative ABC transport system substrate-binding protein
MTRRQFITLLGAAAAWPQAASAQTLGTRPLLAALSAGQLGTAPIIAAFQEGMRALGYLAGRNIDVVYRFAESRPERLPGLAEELVRFNPTVIFAPAIVDALAARKATSVIPIVSAALADPVNLGLVASLTRPRGNVTGIMPYVEGLSAKHIELAREIVPGAGRIGILGNMDDPDAPRQRRELGDAAQALGLKIIVPNVLRADDIETAIMALVNEQVEVIIVMQTAMLVADRRQIAALVAARWLPAVYGYREHVEAGGLISYGVDLSWCGRRAATYVHQILTGTEPRDLPVELATQIELAVNLKAAKALALAVPPTLLGAADAVIE